VIKLAARLGVVVSMVALASLDAAGAEQTRPPPPVNVVTVQPAAPANAQLEPDDLPPPQLEVVSRSSVIDMPAIPEFRLAAAEPGFHTPRELQVRGAPLLGTEIKVKGYVTWIYSCRAALAAANPRLAPSAILRAIDEDPALCEQPKIYLGDTRDTPRSASIWVVDMPRSPNQLERKMLSKDELRAWPEPPSVAVGDYVVVTGTWALRSPHAEHHSDGLLVYRAVAPAAAPAAADAAPPLASAATEPASEVITTPPLRKVVDASVRELSIHHLNACNKAIAGKRYDAAIAACQEATRTWEGNHLAWYARAGAHMAKREWHEAQAAIEHAVAQRPDLAMYQLYHGMALYEVAQLQVRAELARKQHRRPDEVSIDPSVLHAGQLDAARDALLRAVKLAPDLWRAHYYLGRIHRDLDEPRLAAEQLTQTVKTHPGYRFGYVALVELYRRWGYVDQSLVVATLGTLRVPAAEAADLWLQVAMAYDAKAADDKAIAAIGKALAARPDDTYAKLQRGRIYFRKGEIDSARRDLEDVAKAADPKLDAARQLAAQMLLLLTSGRPAHNAMNKSSCTASNICVILPAPNSGWAGENPLTRL
jgi:tetratricopeptide (TPR) repeat protein